MIKIIEVEGLPYNRAEVKALLLDGSAKVELFNVDEQGEEIGARDLLASFSTPLPFELTDDEIEELNNKTETQWTAD